MGKITSTSERGRTAKQKAIPASFTLARSMMWPLLFAGKLALARKSRKIELCDFLGGLFIAEFEKLSRYYQDWQRLEDLVRSECGITKPVWFYRIDLYHDLQRKRQPSRNKLIPFSSKVAELLQASEIGNSAVDSSASGGRLEDVLRAISRNDSVICQNFSSAVLALFPAHP